MSDLDTDKVVAAILAASKLYAEKPEKPLDYVVEYRRMLRILERRAVIDAAGHQTKDAADAASKK